MSHDAHEGPEDAVLYDGCAECDDRATDPFQALLRLDGDNFKLLRDRMVSVEFGDDGDRAETGGYRTDNEAQVGRALYYIALLEQRHGRIL